MLQLPTEDTNHEEKQNDAKETKPTSPETTEPKPKQDHVELDLEVETNKQTEVVGDKDELNETKEKEPETSKETGYKIGMRLKYGKYTAKVIDVYNDGDSVKIQYVGSKKWDKVFLKWKTNNITKHIHNDVAIQSMTRKSGKDLKLSVNTSDTLQCRNLISYQESPIKHYPRAIQSEEYVSMITAFLFILFLILFSIFQEVFLAVICGFVYLIYGYTCQMAREYTQDLANVYSGNKLKTKIDTLENSKPMIAFEVKCHHKKTWESSNEGTQIDTKITLQKKMNYAFTTWKDISSELKLKPKTLTGIYLKRTYGFGNIETKNDHNKKAKAFCQQNDNGDKYLDFTCSFGPQSETIYAVADDSAFVISRKFYILASIFLCSTCYRQWLRKRKMMRNYVVQKEIQL